MPEYLSEDEIDELSEGALREYLDEVDVFSEREWDLYTDLADDYTASEITRRTFTGEDGTEYLLSVELASDGETADEMDASINVVRLDAG